MMRDSAMYVVRYIISWGCGIALIVGVLAVIFEESLIIRIIGGVTALSAVIIGNVLWKKKADIAAHTDVGAGSDEIDRRSD